MATVMHGPLRRGRTSGAHEVGGDFAGELGLGLGEAVARCTPRWLTASEPRQRLGGTERGWSSDGGVVVPESVEYANDIEQQFQKLAAEASRSSGCRCTCTGTVPRTPESWLLTF